MFEYIIAFDFTYETLKGSKKLELILNIELEEQFYQQYPSAGENYGIT